MKYVCLVATKLAKRSKVNGSSNFEKSVDNVEFSGFLSLSLSLSLPFGNVFLPWRMPCVNANACTWRDAIGHLSSSTSDERRPRVSFSRPDAPMTNRSGLFPDYLPFSPFLLFHLLLALYQKSTSHDDQVARTNFFFLFFFSSSRRKVETHRIVRAVIAGWLFAYLARYAPRHVD